MQLRLNAEYLSRHICFRLSVEDFVDRGGFIAKDSIAADPGAVGDGQ